MHEGHRQRMYEKLVNGTNLFDHELLEILLYSVYPRINTNVIAHALLSRFVSIYGVFTASIDELKEVEGVGDNAAYFLKTMGLCAQRAGTIGNAPTIKNYGDLKRFMKARFEGNSTELVELYFLSKTGNVMRVFSETTSEKSKASSHVDKIARNVALYRPHSIVAAHNHVDGEVMRSHYDDEFTNVVQFICEMNDVEFYDHVIYCGGEFFSYRDENLLIGKGRCNWETFEKWIKTLN